MLQTNLLLVSGLYLIGLSVHCLVNVYNLGGVNDNILIIA